jgi:hypothetical protein
MKIKRLPLLLVVCLSLPSFGQDLETILPVKKWTISSFSLTAGMQNDRYMKMDLETMRELTANPSLLDRNLDGYDEQLNRNSSGIRLGGSITLRSANQTTNGFDREVRIGAYYSTREPVVYFTNTVNEITSSILYCNLVNEVSIDGAYLLSKRPARIERLKMYTGIGLSIGSTFNNKSIVMESTYGEDVSTYSEDKYRGKSGLISRLYLPVGMEFTVLKKLALGLEGNLGVGMQNVYSGKSYLIPVTSSLQAKLTYQF